MDASSRKWSQKVKTVATVANGLIIAALLLSLLTVVSNIYIAEAVHAFNCIVIPQSCLLSES